jgi:hypothetical protein
MDELTLPPHPASPHRQAVTRWAAMYDRTNTVEDSPNYSRWLSNIVAGLMQARPPQANYEADWLDLSELLEDTTRIQASQGVCFLRPVHDGESWVVQALSPERVAAVWAHRRLVSAMVWTISADPMAPNDATRAVAVVERWAEKRVVHEFWQGDLSTAGVFTGKRQWTAENLPDILREVSAISGALVDIEMAADV